MIRNQVESHYASLKTWKGRASMAAAYAALVLALPILALAVIVTTVVDAWRAFKWNRANGHCVKCGHFHQGPLGIGQDAHGWTAPKVCKG